MSTVTVHFVGGTHSTLQIDPDKLDALIQDFQNREKVGIRSDAGYTIINMKNVTVIYA